ncbi:MAG: hypothetical protein AAB375_00165 [Patescibacteria group bacterium]
MASKKKQDKDEDAPRGRLKASDEVRLERKIRKLEMVTKRQKAKYNAVMAMLNDSERVNEALVAFEGPVESFRISAKAPEGGSEATAFAIASDWHVEERVDPRTVNGLNRYDLELADRRAVQFFQNTKRLIDIMGKDVEIKTLVLALLGDFITNDIHEDLVEINQLSPMDAALKARELLVSGIRFLLDNTKLDLVVPCHSGNHGRTTKKVHISTERGHSLEFLMYASLVSQFRDEPRVKFLLADGYHSYLEIYGKTIRFHHGHEIRYQGGVGGIYIPVNKAIAQWNKGRWADLDVFGHFHQAKHGGNFISNGSLIGFNAFALSIKADFEPPKQSFFLWDRKRGQTIYAPILFDDKKSEPKKEEPKK